MTWTEYLHPYYVSNILILLAYPASRVLKLLNFRNLDNPDELGLTRENTIFYTIMAFVVIKWFRRYSIAQFLSDVFYSIKLALISGYLLVDIRAALAYSTACLTVWLFFKQPLYSGPNKIININTIEEYEQELGIEILEDNDPVEEVKETLDPKQKKKQKKKKQEVKNYRQLDEIIVCEFYVDWAETCIFTKEIWAEYSLKYSNKKLRFLSVNLQQLPKLSKLYSINTSTISRQLPTVILFENGEECQRFPPIDPQTKQVPKVLKYDRKEIAKYFDLDRRYVSTRDN